MAKIRNTKWKNADGSVSHRFQLTYYDANGKRHRELFTDKNAAESEKKRIETEHLLGNPSPNDAPKTVAEGLDAWLLYMEKLVRLEKRERVTVRHYRTHIDRHIAPLAISKIRFRHLSSAEIVSCVESLETNLSHELAVKVYATLRMALGYFRRKQWLSNNPCEEVKLERPRRYEGNPEDIKIPPKAEIKALLEAAKNDISGRSTAMLRLMVFHGLRISEIRGLPRKGLELVGKTPQISVTQRADDYSKIGPPKSQTSYRTLALSPEDVLGLKKWLLAKGIKDDDSEALVFGNGVGNADSYQNLFYRWWFPLMTASGLAKPVFNKKTKKQDIDPKTGKPRVVPNFTPHQLRHSFASLCIEHGVQPKQLQVMMGHSSITITMDTYGHLWKDKDADQALAVAVEQQLG